MAVYVVNVYIESSEDDDTVREGVESVLSEAGVDFREIEICTFDDE